MKSKKKNQAVTGRRLLVLDDDPLAGGTIRAIAQAARFEVEVTTEAGGFFRRVEAWRPDFIAIDLVMPGMDGVEVINELARRQCKSRLIIISGVGSRVLDAARRSALEHGLSMAGVLAKPFTPSGLRQLLRTPGPVAERGRAGVSRAFTDAEKAALTAEELRRAIAESQLFMVYQPKVVCQTGVLTGFEVLARWRHPRRGIIGPDGFISLAEANGLIDDLTLEVFRQSLGWFKAFQEAGAHARWLGSQDPARLTLSVNISALSLSNAALFERIAGLCQELEINPGRLIFELTETSAMEDPTRSLDLLTQLRVKEFRLSIDDFGTGYSSMVQLVRLPFSEIKVDKSFVTTTQQSAESRAVIKSIVDLGHGLNLRVAAEGIEDEETMTWLANLGCDYGQGHWIARPLTDERVAGWLKERGPSNEQRRLAALRSLNILDTEPEARFDSLTQLAQRLFNVPMAIISLVDEHRLWFKSHPEVPMAEVPRRGSFCTFAIQSEGVFIVPDTTRDARFSHSPIVKNPPSVRFYAGYPVHANDGSRVGTLSLLDRAPRSLSATEEGALRHLAKLVEKEIMSNRARVKMTDEETGVLNRGGFEARISDAFTLCGLLGFPSAFMVLKLNSLEAAGEDPETAKRNGYKTAEFARLVSGALRASDIVGHFGQGELTVLLVGTGINEVEDVQERLGKKIADYNRNALKGLELSYDVGIAVSPRSGDNENPQTLLARAEMNLGKARPAMKD